MFSLVSKYDVIILLVVLVGVLLCFCDEVGIIIMNRDLVILFIKFLSKE